MELFALGVGVGLLAMIVALLFKDYLRYKDALRRHTEWSADPKVIRFQM